MKTISSTADDMESRIARFADLTPLEAQKKHRHAAGSSEHRLVTQADVCDRAGRRPGHTDQRGGADHRRGRHHDHACRLPARDGPVSARALGDVRNIHRVTGTVRNILERRWRRACRAGPVRHHLGPARCVPGFPEHIGGRRYSAGRDLQRRSRPQRDRFRPEGSRGNRSHPACPGRRVRKDGADVYSGEGVRLRAAPNT